MNGIVRLTRQSLNSIIRPGAQLNLLKRLRVSGVINEEQMMLIVASDNQRDQKQSKLNHLIVK